MAVGPRLYETCESRSCCQHVGLSGSGDPREAHTWFLLIQVDDRQYISISRTAISRSTQTLTVSSGDIVKSAPVPFLVCFINNTQLGPGYHQIKSLTHADPSIRFLFCYHSSIH